MNDKAAKALRHAVYGEQSIRQKRRYYGVHTGTVGKGQTIINDPEGLRALYQKTKRGTA